MQIVSHRDNLHVVSNFFFLGKIRKHISKCRLLRILPSDKYSISNLILVLSIRREMSVESTGDNFHEEKICMKCQPQFSEEKNNKKKYYKMSSAVNITHYAKRYIFNSQYWS